MPQHHNRPKIILVILDGWGYSSKYHGNAIKQAYTPTLDLLWHSCPRALLHASENHVGLPKNQMGNSEVGHATIGGGRTVNQALVRISNSIEAGSFFNNKTIHGAYQTSSRMNKQMHLIGLCSDGGVHSHIHHLIALIKISKLYKSVKTCLHIITDGRDTKPQSAIKFIKLIAKEIKGCQNIDICTISGRYYSMDRDCRWQRTMQAYECLISNNVNWKYNNNIFTVIKNSYKKDIYDEFIIPTRIKKGAIEDSDSVICFNFRPDRMLQLVQALSDDSFAGFQRKRIHNIRVTTFTAYDSKLNTSIVFKKIENPNFLGEIISQQGFKQLRLAETEKYAHVSYFFNGGKEVPFPGEYRELVPSPRVETYDVAPEMSADCMTRKLIESIKKNRYQLIVTNYANPDIIGHTGNIKATKKAIEAVDSCISYLLEKTVHDQEIKIMITADHGNADIMLDQNNEPSKSHTQNLVPFIITRTGKHLQKPYINEKNVLRKFGSLADIAPTILDILKIKQPSEMSGKSLMKL